MSAHEANGRLMAAAPELADALEMLLSACRPAEATFEKCRDAPGVAVAALRKAGRLPVSAQPWTGGSITGLFGGWAGQLASDPMQGGEWVACSSCSRPTRMTGTKLCDRCWEHQRNARQAEGEEGPQFGERLRAKIATVYDPRDLFGVADAIDQDAEELRRAVQEVESLREMQRQDLRLQVEEVVERLRYSIEAHPHARYDLTRKDVLDAEPFLAELNQIFGHRQEATPWPLADVLARLCAAADHLLGHHNCDCHGYEEVVAARDAARRWEGKS